MISHLFISCFYFRTHLRSSAIKSLYVSMDKKVGKDFSMGERNGIENH